MGLKEDKEQIKAINDQIKELSRQLRQTPTFFKAGDFEQAKTYLTGLQNQLKEVDSDLNFIAESFKRSVDELSKQNIALNQGKSSLRAISNISSQLLNIKYGEIAADSQSLEKLQQKAKLKFDELNQAILLLETQSDITDAQKAQLAELKNSANKQSDFLRGQKEILDLQRKIEGTKGVKLFDGLGDIAKAIPGLNKFTGAFQEAAEASKDQARQIALNAEAVEKQNKAAEKQREADLQALKSGKELNQQQLERLFTKEQISKAGLDEESKKQRKIDLEALKSGKGLTKESLKRLGIEKKFHTKDNLSSLKTGKGLTKEKIKQLGLEKKLLGTNKAGQKVELAGSHAAVKARKLLAAKVKPLKNIVPKGAVKPLVKAAPKAITSAFKVGAKILVKTVSKLLGPIGLLIELVMALFQGDKAAGELAKAMNMTYVDALATRREFTNIAESSNNIFITTKGIQETFLALNNVLGSNVMLNKESLIFATQMREQMGFSQETINSTFKLSEAFGKSMEDITGEVISQADITASNLGVQVEEKKILAEVANVSAATTLSLKGSGREIAKALTTAKAFGMTMAQIEKSAEGLLNFESSLTSELKAELLLGKNINLERARLAAINNKVGEVAREIASQIGSAAEFGELNNLQQKALAEAVGMTRNELAETLFTQEAIGNATGEEAEERKRVISGMLRTMSLEEAQNKLKDEGIEKLKNQAAIQDRFSAMLDKLTEIAVQIGEPLLEILSPIADFAAFVLPKLIGSLQPFIGIIKMIFLGIKGIGQAVGALFGNDAAAASYGDTFSEAGDAFTGGMNRGFDVQYGKDSFLSEMGLGVNQLSGLDENTTLFGEQGVYNATMNKYGGGSNSNQSNQSADFQEMQRMNQEQFRIQNNQMQELINSTNENRPPVDMFGGNYDR